MKKINIRRTYFHLRHQYFTMNNVVIAIAITIGASWAWGSIGVMQRNYALQKEVDSKSRQLKITQLQTKNMEFEKKYFESTEYQELEVRKRLGYGYPGEKVLLVPPNSPEAKEGDVVSNTDDIRTAVPSSDFQQWMNFLFGGNRQNLQK